MTSTGPAPPCIPSSREASPLEEPSQGDRKPDQGRAPAPFRPRSLPLGATSDSRDDESLRSVPEVVEPFGVASLGFPATDADHVKTLWAGLERADNGRGDAQHVPRCELDDLVIELGAT